MASMNIAIVGAGRAGTSLDAALRAVGHHVTLVHHDDLPVAFDASLDLVILAVPDDAIAAVAARLVLSAPTVLAHLSGARGRDVLRAHPRVGSLHPLAILTDPSVGATRMHGGVFAVAGDELLYEVVASLDGRVVEVSEERRVLYHATAVAAANHVVALMAHVEILAHGVGLDLADFLPLARQALDDVAALGPQAALTGPVARGDVATIKAHLAAVPEAERSTYAALAQRAQAIVERAVEVSWNV